MPAAAFDTLKRAQNLRAKANFSPEQAEGLSEALSQAITGELATRADLADLVTKGDLFVLKGDLSALKDEVKDELRRLKGKIDASKTETLRWIVGAIGFQTIAMMGTAFGLVRFFVH